MSKQQKRILTVLICANLAIVLISVLYVLLFVRDRGSAPAAIECSFKRVFGLYCPGCGGSRSVYHLLTLDIWRSFVLCPAVPVTSVIILALDIRAVIALAKDDLSSIKSFKSTTFLVIPAILLLNFVIRNIFLLCGIDYIGDIYGIAYASISSPNLVCANFLLTSGTYIC